MKRNALILAMALAMLPAQVAAASASGPYDAQVLEGASAYNATSDLAPLVVIQSPLPSARLQTYYPTISARIESRGASVNRSSIQLYVDGRDVTLLASQSDETITYVPRARLEPGWHDVFLQGTDEQNHAFSASWTFASQGPDATTAEPATSDFEFFPAGGTAFVPGTFMHFVLLAPANGFAVLHLCGFGAIPFIHAPFSPLFFATVPITPGFPNAFVNCRVSAFFTPFNSFNTFLVNLPVGITIWPDRKHVLPRTTLPEFQHAVPVTVMPSNRVAPIAMPRTTLPDLRPVPPHEGLQPVPQPPLRPALQPLQPALEPVRPLRPFQPVQPLQPQPHVIIGHPLPPRGFPSMPRVVPMPVARPGVVPH